MKMLATLEAALEEGNYAGLQQIQLEGQGESELLAYKGLILDSMVFQGHITEAKALIDEVFLTYSGLLANDSWYTLRFRIPLLSFNLKYGSLDADELTGFKKLLKSLEDKKTTDSLYKKWSARGHHTIANYCLDHGLLVEAEKAYNDALTIRRTISDKKGISSTLNKLSLLLQLKGNVSSALEYSIESMILDRQLGNDQAVAVSELTLGSLYRQQGNMQKSITYLQKSIVQFSSTDNAILLSKALFELFITTLSSEEAIANDAVEELLGLDASIDHSIDSLQKAAQALRYAGSKRGKDRYKGQEMLEELLVKPEQLEYQLYAYLLLHYISLLIDELNAYHENVVLLEIVDRIEQAKQLATNNNAMVFLLELQLLDANFELIKGNTEQALHLMETVQQQAAQHLLVQIEHEATDAISHLKENILLWKQRTSESRDLVDRLQENELKNYVKDMLERFNL